jgi:MoxR-like ATPase
MASEQASGLRCGDELIGRGRAACELRAQIAAAAQGPSTVLITGETGTGKGVVARAIHAGSLRAGCPFVHLDCASVAEGTFESELFGHERGAFTDARDRRTGRLEAAGAGTLFVDEIGELGPRLQAKLLRMLQERAFERVGGNATLELRARVIAATNRDLGAAVQRGTFRADLFYRLDVLRIHVPPLRERLEDLPLLVAEGSARASRALGRSAPRISEGFLARLRQHVQRPRALRSARARARAHGVSPGRRAARTGGRGVGARRGPQRTPRSGANPLRLARRRGQRLARGAPPRHEPQHAPLSDRPPRPAGVGAAGLSAAGARRQRSTSSARRRAARPRTWRRFTWRRLSPSTWAASA